MGNDIRLGIFNLSSSIQPKSNERTNDQSIGRSVDSHSQLHVWTQKVSISSSMQHMKLNRKLWLLFVYHLLNNLISARCSCCIIEIDEFITSAFWILNLWMCVCARAYAVETSNKIAYNRYRYSQLSLRWICEKCSGSANFQNTSAD